jgi:integrase
MGVKVREKEPGSGVYWLFVHHKGQRASLQIGSLKAANKAKEEVEAKVKLGLFSFEKTKPAPIPTLREYFGRFERTYLKTAVRESTADKYDANFKVHVLPALGKKRLDHVSRQDMEEFIAHLVVGKKLAKATIETILRTLGRVFSFAKKHKLVSENPVSGLGELYTQAPIRHEKIEPLTPEEVPPFLEAARAPMPSETKKVKVTRNGKVELVTVTGKRDWSLERHTLFLCAIHTGLRVGEQLALEWGDIDWRSKIVSVERSYDRVHRKVVPTKNKKLRRVDLSDEALEALQTLRKDRLEAWFGRDKAPLVAAGLWDDTVNLPKVIFCNEDGGYLDGSNLVDRHFFRCLQAAGLKRRRYHDLRHTFASLLLTAGAPIAYVSEQMGHSSIELTVKRYGHLIPGANRKFVNNLPGSKSAPQAHPTQEAAF